MTNRIGLAGLLLTSGMLVPGLATRAAAQSVQPVIMEYKGSADGKLILTNNTEKELVVVLEPKSFNISLEGVGTFRPLDPGIKVELSRTSVRLEPKQTYYIFYKASSLTLPAWFTIYAAFSQVQHGQGMDVRMLLPHTVYLYQKDAIQQSDIEVVGAVFSPQTKKLVCYLQNDGNGLVRVQDVKASGAHAAQDSAGFPLLPAGKRKIELDWQEKNPPSEISFRFEHFTVKHPVAWEAPAATP